MRDDRSLAEVNLDIDLGRHPEASKAPSSRDEIVFRLGICGDFRARSDTNGQLASWRVDRDDIDDVLSAMAPTLHLALGSGVVADVTFRELDDFHPDRLFDRVPQFAPLRELRAQLANPSTFGRAAAQLAVPSAPAEPPKRPSLPSTGGSLLDSIVGEETPSQAIGAATNDLYEFIQRSMAPHLVARADPRQADVLAQVDASIASIMRALLHHPAYQAMESLWRGVFRCVRHVDTDARLQIHLIDVTRDELVADLLGTTSAQNTALYQRLEQHAPAEDGGWGALVVHCTFGEEASDLTVLARLAEVGRSLDAPWLAEAHPDLALGGLPEPSAAVWGHLRKSAAARYLALAMPRVLLRLPYGKDTDSIERFAFEELEKPDAHASYLWGNPAVFCATLLAEGFSERGSGLGVGSSSEIGGLPLHLVRRDGDVHAKPCAEVLMSEDDVMALLEAGIIPMLSYRDRDMVRVARIQSVADPLARLGGRLAE